MFPVSYELNFKILFRLLLKITNQVMRFLVSLHKTDSRFTTKNIREIAVLFMREN
jgi:hypothetical protein